MLIQRQNNSSNILPHEAKLAYCLTLADLTSNMPLCYCGINNFAEWRRNQIWIFSRFPEEEQMWSKTFCSRSGNGVKKW